MWRVRLLIIVSLLACGCGELRSPTEPIPDDPPVDPSATFARVQNEVFTPLCAFSGCHGNIATQQGMNLTAGVAYENVVNVPSTELPQLDRVEPERPDRSYLFLKVTGAEGIVGDRMPLGQPELTSAQKELISNWIRRGAPND